MADRRKQAHERVREALERNPGATTQELKEAALTADASVADLSPRQFNAGFVLPLKRVAAAARKREAGAEDAAPRRGRKGQGGGRKRLRRPRKAAEVETAAPAVRRKGGDGERDRVRNTLLEFARDFSEAETRPAIVAVLSDLDRYIDQIVGERG